ncbi:MAG TPA: ABC transporter permease [Gaiellaceae bacterium]
MKVLAIVKTELTRTFRWRANIFFLLIMPMGLILLLGVAFGSSATRIGVVEKENGQLARQLVANLGNQPGLDTKSYDNLGSLEKAVERGYVSAGLVLGSDYDQRLHAGKAVTVRYFARPDSVAPQIRVALESAVAAQGSSLVAARIVHSEQGTSFESSLQRVSAVKADPSVSVNLLAAGGGKYPSGTGQFQQSASTQLLLFAFLSALNGAVWLIETRRLGVARRMLSTPSSSREIMLGIVLGRWVITLLQSAVIVFFSWLLFSVNWGDPFGTGAIVLVFSLVAVGAGVLIGTLFSSAQQAGPIAMIVGLVFAAIGGSMEPLQYFPATMRKIAHITPHAWANDAFGTLLSNGGNLSNVWLDVVVLGAYAAALLTLATWRLRRVLTT